MASVEGQRSFYAAALAALRFVEARRPTKRRFGPDADATWAEFRGDLGSSARIDLLLRDADAQWPGSFGARLPYGLGALAADEPFGAAWVPLDDVDAAYLLGSFGSGQVALHGAALARGPGPGTPAGISCCALWYGTCRSTRGDLVS
jgi:hypothetical protein